MQQLYVTLDDTNHAMGQGEHTVCYLPVPIGSPSTFDQPDDLCDKCADGLGIEQKPKAAKKRGSA